MIVFVPTRRVVGGVFLDLAEVGTLDGATDGT